MKLDWCKDSGQWNIWDIETGSLLAKKAEVQILVPSVLVTTDGGRHGYLVARGRLDIEGNRATIRKG